MQTVAGVGGSLLRARPSAVYELEIPLPSTLAEQERIAGILDKADGVRRKRAEALRLTDELLRSVFLEMFGDPVTNPKGWPVKPLAEGVESFEGGWNVNPIEAPRTDGVRVLKVSAVTSGEYRANESKSFNEDEAVPEAFLVRKEDLLISRANTAELVGAVAYVWETSGLEMLPDKLWRFVWPQKRSLEPLFMLHLARSVYFRKQLIQRATGSSGSMKNIGKAKMLEIPIPYPPINLQKKFTEIAIHIRETAIKATTGSENAELLFAALQQRAFSGQL
jgi:type I restriction enzyme S subunit